MESVDYSIIVKILPYYKNNDLIKKRMNNTYILKEIINLLSLDSIYFTDNIKEIFHYDYTLNKKECLYKGNQVNCLTSIPEYKLLLIGDERKIILYDYLFKNLIREINLKNEIFILKAFNEGLFASLDSGNNLNTFKKPCRIQKFSQIICILQQNNFAKHKEPEKRKYFIKYICQSIIISLSAVTIKQFFAPSMKKLVGLVEQVNTAVPLQARRIFAPLGSRKQVSSVWPILKSISFHTTSASLANAMVW